MERGESRREAGAFRPDLLRPLLDELGGAGLSGELSVRGASMRPALCAGDRVRLVSVAPRTLRVGDLVARPGPAGPIIHRLVGWWPSPGGWRMLTKGDNASRFDPLLPAEGAIGRVIAWVREGREERLDDPRPRRRGRRRAAVSLAGGLIAEAWDRARGIAGRRARLPEE